MSTTTTPLGKRVLSQQAVLEKVPVSRVTIWRLERAGLFPKRIQLSPNRVGWLEADVDGWLEERKTAQGGNGGRQGAKYG